MRRSFLLLPVLGAMWLYACADTSNDSDLDDPPGNGGSSAAGSAGQTSAGKGGAGQAGRGGAGQAGVSQAGAGAGGSPAGGAGEGGAGAGGAPSEDTDALCSDGKDNDNNGFADCGDINCASNPNVTVCGQGGASGAGGGEPFGGSPGGGEDTNELCTDGVDNDGDKYVDCEDKGCCSVVDCKALKPGSYCAKNGAGGSTGGAEDTGDLCSDGKDNDGDKYVDCEDKGCCSVVDCKKIKPTSYCAKQGSGGTGGSSGNKENTEALCSDGKDNDGDSFEDCDDYECCDFVDCQQVDPQSACAKQGSGGSGGSGGSSSGVENTAALCSDGKDNDGDKFIDCEDKGCCPVVDCKKIKPTSYCAENGTGGSSGSSGESTAALCSDGKDNDGDKFIDCEDKDCCPVVDCSSKPTSYCAKNGSGGSGGSGGTSGGSENTAALCSDGISNDGDSYIDCEDKDCCPVVDCKTLKPTSYCAKQ